MGKLCVKILSKIKDVLDKVNIMKIAEDIAKELYK
jgi:hypothetical protein